MIVTKHVVSNITIPANTETQVAIPNGCGSFDIQMRSGQQAIYSHIPNGTQNGPYFTMKAGAVISEKDLSVKPGEILYFLVASDDVVELFLGMEA